MSTTCLISNFNYAPFVVEAIEGALRQAVPFDEIIVVDDGSTDGSIELLKRSYATTPRVQIIDKGHDGQLSCFNSGAARATGDIVFFLDADDVYEPQYLEEALSVYRRHPSCDFLFCGRRLFGLQDAVLLPYPNNRDFGYSVLSTAHHHRWIGAATSCLSMRRTVLNKILPIPFVEDWRVRADDCLVFGASLAPARKRYLAQPLVRYRVHQNNYYHGKLIDQSSTYRRRLAINRLFRYLECKLGYNLERLTEFHHREFCTIESPTLQQLADYFFIGRSARISLGRRMACFVAMIRHYLVAKWRGNLDPIVDEAEVSDGPITLPFSALATSEKIALPLSTATPHRQRLAA
jgi:glycosyltransferase involved in cell wall biosynthesis